MVTSKEADASHTDTGRKAMEEASELNREKRTPQEEYRYGRLPLVASL